jgi:hypothetical protein
MATGLSGLRSDGSQPGDVDGPVFTREERIGTNEALVAKLEALESNLSTIMQSLDAGECEIDHIRTDYESLNTSLSLLFGEISHD